MQQRRRFTNRQEAEAFANECRANNTFVRWSESRVRVSNRVAASAAAFRPRWNFDVTFNDPR